MSGDANITVTPDIVPDEEHPYGVLTAFEARKRDDPPLATMRVASSFKLSETSALAWIEGGYRQPE